MGTYEPRPDGTLFALGHREDPLMIRRLVRQCYYDMLDAGCEATAKHTAKRLYEQLTGSIDQRRVSEAMFPPSVGRSSTGIHQPAWANEDDRRLDILG